LFFSFFSEKKNSLDFLLYSICQGEGISPKNDQLLTKLHSELHFGPNVFPEKSHHGDVYSGEVHV